VPGTASAAPAAPTFTADIAPIVFSQCAGCHRPGGSAPFNLLTYDDVRRHAPSVADVTRRRLMPPWKPERDEPGFEGVRRLTDGQIELIQRWIDAGGPEGDPAALPPLPVWSSSWSRGEPDLVLAIERPYVLRASGDDMYRHFVLPVPITSTQYVKAWELRVNNTRVVHHATMELDRTGVSRALDAEDPEVGYEGLIAHSVTAPDGFFLDWAPGHAAYVAPEGMAFPIEKGSDLVLMLHLRPSGKPEEVHVSVGFYFADRPPTRVPAMLRLTRQDFTIAPGERRHVVSSSYRLPVDVDVFTIQPHAHYLARKIEGFATLPDGTRRNLIRILDWDVSWQDVYRYVKPLALPAGTTVTMEWTFDNSADNPANPTSPPRLVTFGQRTSDEMAELWMQVFPRNAADRERLVRDMRAGVEDQNLAGYEAMIRQSPDNATLHNDAAGLYLQAGKLDRAAQHLSEVVRLRPASASAAYNLGTVRLRQSDLSAAKALFERSVSLDPDYANAYRSLGVLAQQNGRAEEAMTFYRKAIALAPGDATARYNTGVLLHAQGRIADALAEYREAGRLDPGLADARYGVAVILKQEGRTRESRAEYREALRIRPEWTSVLLELAWDLTSAADTTRDDVREAIQLAQRAAAVRQTPAALDVLAAAFAAAGDFDNAVASCRKALSILESSAAPGIEAALRRHLAWFEQGARLPAGETPLR
jgi:tetratricopeptide (TPR) repeat protein